MRATLDDFPTTEDHRSGTRPMTREDRRRQTRLAPKCRCGNCASFGFDTCSRCREQDEEAKAKEEDIAYRVRRVMEADDTELRYMIAELIEKVYG